MAMAGSFDLRVIFKAIFESNLPPGGFLQKDFPPDFHLVLCSLSSSSSGRTLQNCLQIHQSISYRHFQTLPISICNLSFEPMHSHSSLLPKSLLMNSLLVFSTFSFQRWNMAVAEHAAIHGHIVKSQLLFQSAIYYFYYFGKNRCQPADTGCWVLASSNRQVIKILLKENIGYKLDCHWLPSIARHSEC